ncbi:MAG: alpha/beta hydrolase-fold protein [Bryobacteraceae bacterium]
MRRFRWFEPCCSLATLLIFPAYSSGENVQLRSRILKEVRQLSISTPEGYRTETDGYPVLYILDGETHADYASGIVRFLADNDRIPKLIVVGIESGSLERRRRDFTTPSESELDKRFSPGGGGADQFSGFLSEELIPYVENNYRTKPFKILVGHSLGGLFAVHTLITAPKLFNAFIAMDPSLEWNDRGEVAQAEKFFRTTKELPGDLVLTASNDLGNPPAGVRRLATVLETKAPTGLRWKYEWMKDETHSSIPLPSLFLGLNSIFDGWHLTSPLDLFDRGGMNAIHRHFREGGKRYGYDRTTSPFIVSLVVAGLINAGRLEEASKVLFLDTAAYPPPWNQLDAIARAYAKRNDSEQAIRFYQLSLKQNPRNEWARRKLAEYGVQ